MAGGIGHERLAQQIILRRWACPAVNPQQAKRRVIRNAQTALSKITATIILFSFLQQAKAQSVYLPQGSKHISILDRIEIKMQRENSLNVSTVRPLNRKLATEAAMVADSLSQTGAIALTSIDRYNIQSLLMNNAEWVTTGKSTFASRKPLWNTIYRTKANFFEVDEKDFFLALNPILQFQQSKETDNDQRIFLNTRGITLRGLIARKVGFYTYLAENQERGPIFQQNTVSRLRAVPGAGFYKTFKTSGVDYLDARGGVTFNAAKYIEFRFAYDRNFIGHGYRSMLLSDFSNSYLFLQINTRIWKLNYQNVFMELNPQFVKTGDDLLDKKYAAIHHLSFNATKWLNIGLFESIIFGRKNHFDFTYLNPIIFLRAAEQQNGSPDNAMIGFDLKANVAKRTQFYGQLLLDEFLLKEIRAGKGWWGNKFSMQLGGKYIDALGIPNLDLQAELNVARPFTYSHYDSAANYSHYNQPLAHPLGANFIEAIGIVKFQPIPKLTTSARLIYWKQGTDTGSSNFGSNIFKLYTTRTGDYGFKLPSGIPVTGINTQLLASYELKENLFVDGAILLRKLAEDKSTTFTLGLRMNMFRREYDY